MGLPEIDAQHAFLVKLINICIDSSEKMAQVHIQKEHLGNLRKYVVWHFQSEENLMAMYNYPGIQTHKEEHDDLVTILESSMKKISEKGTGATNLAEIFPGWFGGHSFGYDQEMADFINNIRGKHEKS